MKRAALAFTISIAVTIILLTVSFNLKIAEADGNYDIKNVNHTVKILYNGYILINDTIEISGQGPDSFLLGFPYKYGSYILRCVAYDTQDRASTFPVTLDVPLEDHMGFYGVRIDFSRAAPQVFNAEFVLSNDLLEEESGENENYYTLDFPVFPALTRTVALLNGSIALPEGAQYVSGTTDGFNYSKENLAPFAYNASTLTFSMTQNKIQLFDISQLNRELTVTGSGGIEVSDSYSLVNKGSLTIDSTEVTLLPGASPPSAEDQFGRTMDPPVLIDENTSLYQVSFTLPVEIDRSTRFAVQYHLPREIYVHAGEGANAFVLNVTLFRNENAYINQTSIVLILPEGARLLSHKDTLSGGSYDVDRGVFQETVTMNEQGMTSSDSFSVEIMYGYNSLWSAFRPTVWVWALAIAGVAVAVVWMRARVPVPVSLPPTTLRVGPEFLKSFADSYEEKMKILSEIGSLEARAQKGKVPRRRYKVQRKTLEARLDSLSRSLGDVKEKMRSAGGHYSSLMRQLEVAETEINDVEANVKSIEARHSRGELSLEAYRKLLGDYQHRKDNAEKTIKGVLLRLREEIR